MSRISRLILALSMPILFGLGAPTVFADTVVLGVNGIANEYPFGTQDPGTGRYQPGAVYQQIYNRASFPGSVTITQIAFASMSCTGCTTGTVTENLILRLGTAATSLGSPSATFESNRGADLTTVFSGTMVASLSLNGTFDLVFNLSNPFTYNPANGDLLLDVTTMVSTTYNPIGRVLFDAGFSPDVSRVSGPLASSNGGVDVRYGLRTQFTTGPTAVPEPATMLLLGTGLAGIGVAARKRRRAGSGSST